MLRKALLTGIAIGAMTAGTALAADITYVPPPIVFPPPPPPPAVQAHVELYGGFASFRYEYEQEGSYTDSAFLFGGAGRANVPLQNNWNLQLDAQGSALVFSGGKSSYSDPEFGGYTHVYWRDPTSHALGLFGGADHTGANIYTIGVEGQVYWPDFTLYGQASVSSLQFGPADGTAVQLRGEGQWFFNDDTALLGDLMWTHLSVDSEDGNILTVAGTLIHRFNSGPFSGFLRGRWDHLASDDDVFTQDQWSAVVGIRVSADPFGSTDKSHRRTGPAMDVLPQSAGTCIGICRMAIPG